MEFSPRRRRQAPTVIIVSLIDVLIVVLIFLMMTTTFKQQPAIPLALPQSHQAKAGATDNTLILTVAKDGQLYLKTEHIMKESLTARLTAAVKQNPQVVLAIRADKDSIMGNFVSIMDAAKTANVRVANVYTLSAP